MTNEIHLFIIWSNAMYKADEILTSLKTRFEILDVCVIRWSTEHFSRNLSRFYGTHLPDGSDKESHCGTDPFCLIVVRDPQPVYDSRPTSTGIQRVNTHMFDAKQTYREMTGGGHRIHATNTLKETSHDMMLLLGQSPAEFSATHPICWNGQMKYIARDLPGAIEWESIESLFKVLNATTEYVVLRNFEGLPAQYTLESHGDIDLLCTDLPEMRFITNARAVFDDSRRVLHEVTIAGQNVLFDFRYLGDDYYDHRWQKEILVRKKLASDCFYRPDARNYFFSLLYHAAVHKQSIKPDYVDRLCVLSEGITALTHEDFAAPSHLKAILDRFLDESGYQYVEPVDLSVYFNPFYTHHVELSLDRIFGTSDSINEALGRLVRQSEDCSTDSPKFRSLPFRSNDLLRHHFSPRRYALLSALKLNKSARVLEVGAQTGAVTRYLGENFSKVVAIELDPGFAQVAKVRCRDLPAVTIQSTEPQLFESAEKFDLVVFNCDCRLLSGKNATLSGISANLRKMIQLLAPGGVILLSIANPLSVEGICGSGPAIGFGEINTNEGLSSLHLEEIVKWFGDEGVGAHQSFYLFPDHILPEVLISHEAVSRRLRAFGYWAAKGLYSRGKAGQELVRAGEISLAGKLGDLSGGICLLVARDALDLPAVDWQVLSFASELRPAITQTTTCVKSGDDLTVVKNGHPQASVLFEFNPRMTDPLIEGYLADAVIASCVVGRNLKKLLEVLDRIIDFLVLQYRWKPNADAMPPLTVSGDLDLDGVALDAISRNLIFKEDQLQAFDLEWSATIPLPLTYVLYRSLACLQDIIDPEDIMHTIAPHRPEDTNFFDQAIIELINATNRFEHMNDTHLMIFRQFEQRFKTFAFTLQLEADAPSLLELYQRSKWHFANHGRSELDDTLAQLKANYPQYPSVPALTEYIDRQRKMPPVRKAG